MVGFNYGWGGEGLKTVNPKTEKNTK